MNKNFVDVVATKEAALDAESFLLISSIGREQVTTYTYFIFPCMGNQVLNLYSDNIHSCMQWPRRAVENERSLVLTLMALCR